MRNVHRCRQAAGVAGGEFSNVWRQRLKWGGSYIVAAIADDQEIEHISVPMKRSKSNLKTKIKNMRSATLDALDAADDSEQ